MSKLVRKNKQEIEETKAEVMEVEEEAEEEEGDDFGPLFNPENFTFLTREKEDDFCEGQFELNRPFKAAVGFLESPHGSVKLYQGDTSVICAVYGPSEVRMSKELPHRAAVDVLFRPKITGISQLAQVTGWDSTLEERSVESKLTSILESVIFLEDDMGDGFNVILHEFENDGGLFAACVNAAALALINAGCSMRCSFGAVNVLVSGDQIVIDPNQQQINNGYESQLTVVYTNGGDVLYTGLQGKASPRMIKVCMFQAKKAVEEIFKFQRSVQVKELEGLLGKEGGLKVKQEEDFKFDLGQLKLEKEEEDSENENEESESSGSD